jgi:hypothetical protein
MSLEVKCLGACKHDAGFLRDFFVMSCGGFGSWSLEREVCLEKRFIWKDKLELEVSFVFKENFEVEERFTVDSRNSGTLDITESIFDPWNHKSPIFTLEIVGNFRGPFDYTISRVDCTLKG